jgi:hypothetical protein
MAGVLLLAVSFFVFGFVTRMAWDRIRCQRAVRILAEGVARIPVTTYRDGKANKPDRGS